MNFLSVEGVCKTEGENRILNNISFTQERFQKIAVAGETGSGKSTLFKIIAGLVQANEGEVLFENSRVEGPVEKLIPGHQGISYLSQQFELANNYRVEEVLDYANRLTDEQASSIYKVCRIDHLLKRRTNQVSGGEKQRIAIARLLISSPHLLLLDEPYSNLDMIHKNILKEVVHDIGGQLNTTCMLISHDPTDTLSWADQIIVLKDGEIVQQGSPVQVYRRPADTYTAALFGKYNLLSLDLFTSFANLGGINNNLGLITRPEQYGISKEEEMGLKGTIAKSLFLGSAYETEVFILNETIVVKADLSQPSATGDEVYVYFKGET